jgi:phosphoribosylanthranilate isomerase
MQTATFIKICGLTRASDITQAVAAGAHYVGFVLYRHSPRYIHLEAVSKLCLLLPPEIKPVLLFVNAPFAEVQSARQALPHAVLQFHGDETPEQCLELAQGMPFWRAIRMQEDTDLSLLAVQYEEAQALVLDAHVQGYGGGGKVFDWSWVPQDLSKRIILSGGLNPRNVADGIHQIRPWAVDVSSGVEESKGIKSPELMHQFCQAVRHADYLNCL